MYLIVGLGNPGDEYAHTRHNAGFDALDLLADAWGVSYWKNKCGALVAEVRPAMLDGQEVVLVKPQSFMNLSGAPVSKLMKEYKIEPQHVIVIHDDLDLDPGSIRVKQGGGHAGHNGLRSIIDKCGSREFNRIRIGIGRPPGKMPVVDFVLARPRKEALEELEHGCCRASEACASLIRDGLAKTQNTFN
jgi:PTH1 family peptidyl-tRNA hydrolase